MSNKNGHWYTDKNGQHYFVEDGQSPKEGWEASKRRKMISGGKYKISEDGNEYKDVTEDEYNKYEADEAEFDENNEDDFGFDTEDNNDGDNWGLKDYQLEEIEKSLAPNAEMSMSKALDIIGKETEDLVKEGYDLDDAYAMARDNFIDTYSINGENPEENKEVKKYKSVNSDDVYSEDYIRDQIKGMDRTEAFSTMTRLGIDEDDAKEIWVNELNDRGMNDGSSQQEEKSTFEMAREMHIPLDDLEGSNEEKIREMYKEYKKDFRNDYPNQDKMEEVDFKNQFPEYEKGKGGYQYYKYGSNRGYTLHDAEGTTVGFYDLNSNTLYSVDEANNVKKNSGSQFSDGVKYLAPEEIGIDYDNPEASIKYYEKKNNVKLYEQPNGSFKVVPQPYKSKYKSEDYEDARYYPVSDEDRKNAGPKYLGRYHSIYDAAGLDDKDPAAWKKERDMFKYVGDSENGSSIVQGPDGYFSGNPRINSMSFKTLEQARDYLDRKNPEEHKYGVYFKPGDDREYMYRDAEDKYDLEAPDAYRSAREAAKNQEKPTPNKPEEIIRKTTSNWYDFMKTNGSDKDIDNLYQKMKKEFGEENAFKHLISMFRAKIDDLDEEEKKKWNI